MELYRALLLGRLLGGIYAWQTKLSLLGFKHYSDTVDCKTRTLCTEEFNGQLLFSVIRGGQDRLFIVLENWMLES